MGIPEDSAPSYRAPVNGLRGIAALTVAVYHFHYYSDFPWRETFPGINYGFMAVDFFFILSGLIISHVYLNQFKEFHAKDYLVYLFLRFSRLFPAHLFVMLSLLLAALFGVLCLERPPLGRTEFMDWLFQASMVRQWALPEKFVWNSPAWSISAEMFAYALLFPVFARMGNRASRRNAGLLFLAIGFVSLFYLIHRFQSLNLVSNGGPLCRVTFEFMIGAGLYCLFQETTLKERPWSKVFLGGVILLVGVVALRRHLLASNLAVLSDGLVLVAFCLMISGAYKSDQGVSKVLRSKPLFWLGEISFSLYLCHIPIFRLTDYVATSFLEISYRGVAYNAVQLAFAVAAAHLLFTQIEKPSRRFLRHQIGY